MIIVLLYILVFNISHALFGTFRLYTQFNNKIISWLFFKIVTKPGPTLDHTPHVAY